ncbi:hypothetical protein AMTR_s00034p00053520 [Amborella trichopoda]|uniref:Uncharacterized protein n=1 Tax=Amborella trichopoda TaxID=13333 RepID=W1PQ73_AMBTC|nr:hypothetical protein AMTR_s00034p00053520 [Amborella trichopoda]
MTPDLEVASRVQEVVLMIIDPMHESTPAPSSPSRMSLDPCPGEHAPSELEEASKVASWGADEAPITVQVGDEDLCVVGGEQIILSEQPEGVAEVMGDEGSSFIGGEVLILKQHEVVTPEVAEVTSNEGVSTEAEEEPGLSEHSGAAALSEITEGGGDEGPGTIRGETVEESSGAGFELASLEVAIDMAIVSSWVTPPVEVTLVTTTSIVTPSAEVAPIPVSSLTVPRRIVVAPKEPRAKIDNVIDFF